MEGYLTLITKSYTLPKYRKVWVVLDRQQLTWYDRLDPVDQLPKKLKGVLFIKDAKLLKVTDKHAEHALSITCDSAKTLFGCEDGTDCSNWYKALTKSLVYHTEAAARDRLPKEYRDVMGFDADETLSKNLLSRTYKRLCLKEHPDKGGNIEAFNKIKEAYNYLLNLQTYLDELENTVPFTYEVTIRKKAGKVGLGMTVTEDKIHQRLLVGKVNNEIDIISIDESVESIHSGDRLVGIDSDDCSVWITNRLLARLGPGRIPVGGSVVFTLERRVAPEDGDSDGSDGDVYEQTPTPSPVPTTIFNSNNSTANTIHTGNNTPINTTNTPLNTNINTGTTNTNTNNNHNRSFRDTYASNSTDNSTIDTPVNMHPSGNITPISPHPTTNTVYAHNNNTNNTSNHNTNRTNDTTTSTTNNNTHTSSNTTSADGRTVPTLQLPSFITHHNNTSGVSSGGANTSTNSEVKEPQPDPHLSGASAALGSAQERRRAKLAEIAKRGSDNGVPAVLVMSDNSGTGNNGGSGIGNSGTGSNGSSDGGVNNIHTVPVHSNTVHTPIPLYTHTTHTSSASTTLHTVPTVHTVPVEHSTYSAYTPLTAQYVISDNLDSYIDNHASPPPSPPPFTQSMLQQQTHSTIHTDTHTNTNTHSYTHSTDNTSSYISDNFIAYEEFTRQRAALQLQLQQATSTVQAQSECIAHLKAENESLKDTVTSLARFMERKHLEDPLLRTQHIADLHTGLLDSKVQVRTLEQALFRAAGISSGDTHSLNESDTLQEAIRSEQTQQALRVEHMLQTAIRGLVL